MIDFSLFKEQLELQRRSHEFAQQHMIPYAKYYDKPDETDL